MNGSFGFELIMMKIQYSSPKLKIYGINNDTVIAASLNGTTEGTTNPFLENPVDGGQGDIKW